MKLRTLSFCTALGISLGFSAPIRADFGVGDIAPPLSIAEWVKGTPVDLARDAKKRIHVIEFWAVWCGPCKMTIPLLTKLQKKYKKDVAIVGVTTPDAGENSPAGIRRFVRQRGDTMDYTVAIDTGKTGQQYMAAAGAMGIPHAFVVARDGRVAWQGSPLDPELETVLAAMLAGTYDMKSALVAKQVNERFGQLDMLAQLGQWEKVWNGLQEILELDPANEVALRALRDISSQELHNTDAFRRWARSHIDTNKSNGPALVRLAEMLSLVEDLASRDPALALEASRAAYEATQRRGARAITVYARALYQVGALDRAMTLQQDAVAVASEDERESVKAALDFYRRCKVLQSSVR